MYATGDLARWTPAGDSWSSPAAPMSRSRSAASGSSPARSRPRCCRHPGIADAAVIAREDTPGRKHLAAYLVPASDGPRHLAAPPLPAPQPAGRYTELRDHLAAALPDYMVPATFTVLDALPLTANGKLDRRALPRPKRDSAAAWRMWPRVLPPSRPSPRIWADVLGLDQVGIHDNFFELGGDSILSIQIRLRLDAVLGRGLSAARDLRRDPTAGRAGRPAARPGPRQPGGGGGPVIPAVPRGGPLPLSFAQQRLWFLDDLSRAAASTYRRGRFGCAARWMSPRWRQALDALVARHESLRTTLDNVDGHGVQVSTRRGRCPAAGRGPVRAARGPRDAEIAALAQRSAAGRSTCGTGR